MVALYLIKEQNMITGIEELKFGVKNRGQANQFLHDFGLTKMPSDLEGTDLYHTQNGCKIYLFDLAFYF